MWCRLMPGNQNATPFSNFIKIPLDRAIPIKGKGQEKKNPLPDYNSCGTAQHPLVTELHSIPQHSSTLYCTHSHGIARTTHPAPFAENSSLLLTASVELHYKTQTNKEFRPNSNDHSLANQSAVQQSYSHISQKSYTAYHFLL